MLQYAQAHDMQLVALSDNVQSTHRDGSLLASSQEEADTKMILHARDAQVNGATRLEIHSPDTDVLILCIRRFPLLCEDTTFVTPHKSLAIGQIYDDLGAKRAAALPAFHAVTGTDLTGRFAGKGKATCWKSFSTLDDAMLESLAMLGTTEEPPGRNIAAIKKLVCRMYVGNTDLDIPALRWWLFKKKQAQSEGLPPTRAALHPAIRRAHYLCMIWECDLIPHPDLPVPQGYGWKEESGYFHSIMCTMPPAPNAIIHLIKCGCKVSKCSYAMFMQEQHIAVH